MTYSSSYYEACFCLESFTEHCLITKQCSLYCLVRPDPPCGTLSLRFLSHYREAPAKLSAVLNHQTASRFAHITNFTWNALSSSELRVTHLSKFSSGLPSPVQRKDWTQNSHLGCISPGAEEGLNTETLYVQMRKRKLRKVKWLSQGHPLVNDCGGRQNSDHNNTWHAKCLMVSKVLSHSSPLCFPNSVGKDLFSSFLWIRKLRPRQSEWLLQSHITFLVEGTVLPDPRPQIPLLSVYWLFLTEHSI